jgi:hypothetical protein
VDEADRAVPVFGPAPIGRPCAMTGFVNELRVAGPLPGRGPVAALPYPDGLRAEPRRFPARLCDLHVEIGASAEPDPLCFFQCALTCACDMRLAVLLGYDGPVQVWLDGAAAFSDPGGTNPAVEDQARIPWRAVAGRHEIVVALGTNQRRAWGIFLRFEREDVSRGELARGPGAYRMPVVEG